MTAPPSVRLSVVTVCFNDMTNVQHTMKSLAGQRARQGWEHLLVDGASTDGTVDWYQSASFDFPNRVVSEPDNGIFDAMNKSLDIVNGDYVVFMNAGDRYIDEDAIGRVLRRIESEPSWGYSRARVVDEEGRKVRPIVGKTRYSRMKHLFGMAAICHQAVVMRVDLLSKLGGFDARMGHAADYHLLVKAAAYAPPVTWPEVDVEYLLGGVSSVEVHQQLWRRHRARVDALALGRVGRSLDRAWTGTQVMRWRSHRVLKPIVGPIYFRLVR